MNLSISQSTRVCSSWCMGSHGFVLVHSIFFSTKLLHLKLLIYLSLLASTAFIASNSLPLDFQSPTPTFDSNKIFILIFLKIKRSVTILLIERIYLFQWFNLDSKTIPKVCFLLTSINVRTYVTSTLIAISLPLLIARHKLKGRQGRISFYGAFLFSPSCASQHRSINSLVAFSRARLLVACVAPRHALSGNVVSGVDQTNAL